MEGKTKQRKEKNYYILVGQLAPMHGALIDCACGSKAYLTQELLLIFIFNFSQPICKKRPLWVYSSPFLLGKLQLRT